MAARTMKVRMRGMKALTGDEVAAHEGLAQLLGVPVLAVPQGPALRVKVLPKMGQGHPQRVLVGVFALELVQDEGAGDRTTDSDPQSDPKPLSVPTPSVSSLECLYWNSARTNGQEGTEGTGTWGTISTPRMVTNLQGVPKPHPPGLSQVCPHLLGR